MIWILDQRKKKYLRAVFSPKQRAESLYHYLYDIVDLFVANPYQRSMSMKMYVGNLNYNMTEKDLKNLFSPYGEVLSYQIITDQYTRQSKNMGYVEMAVMEEGKKALKALNGQKINDRLLVVRKV